MFTLSRKNKTQKEWRVTTTGDLEYVLFVLKENLQSPPFDKLEWKIEPAK